MAVKITTALERQMKKNAKRVKGDTFGIAMERMGKKNAKPKSFMDKANSMYQQTAGRARSAAGKAGLYDSMLKGKDGKVKGGLTTKGKMAVGGAVGLAGAGMAAGAYNKRQEDKKFKNRVKDRLGIRR